MSAIYKYPLEVQGEQTLFLPAGAKILTIQAQYGKTCLWALVDPKGIETPRKIAIFGTGHPVDRSDLEYIGTFQLHGGQFVGHAFEVTP